MYQLLQTGKERQMKRLQELFREESGYKMFLISVLVTGLGYGLYKGMIDNYLAEIVSMGEFDRGVAEFFREVPGLLLVLILAVFYMYTAEALYKAGAVIMLIGIAMLPVFPPSKILVTLAICVHSLGEHIQLGMKNTLTLEYARPGKGGEALGQQNAFSHIGTLAGYVFVILLFTFFGAGKPYKPFFALTAGFLFIALIFALRIQGQSVTDRTGGRFHFARKFKKYYMLEVFYGARKQVFLTFGPYVLILFYGADARTISILFAVSAVCCYFCAPLVGKIIDRFGYKIVMISDTLILVIVCFFYGFAHHLFSMHTAFIIYCVNYILDSVISLASMASNVYVQDLSDDPEEMKTTISTGVSVNHMITLLIALFGGWIWHALGIETLFILSAILGLCNSAYAATIRTVKRA